MAGTDFDHISDSLDRLDRLLALEEALITRIRADSTLSPSRREELIREVEARADSGNFPEGDDWDDDDALAGFVRTLRPRGPLDSLGASVLPENESKDEYGQT